MNSRPAGERAPYRPAPRTGAARLGLLALALGLLGGPAIAAPASAGGPTLGRLLYKVHSEVNRGFRPRMPWQDVCDLVLDCDGIFDCENYAVEKARRLRQAGVPRADLRLWAVTPSGGGRHAVLLVRDGARWMMLDNLEARPLPAAKVRWYRDWTPVTLTPIALPLD